jgi:N-acylneuraminate cytidylyltransferase
MGHALQWLQRERRSPKFVCCVYPTAPFVRAEDIKRGLDAMEQTGCEYAFSVTSYTSAIQRALRITANGRVEMFHPEHFNTRSQDLEQAFHDAAQFYWGRAEAWLAGTPVFSQVAVPIIIERHRVQDIDTPEDWHRAELMFNAIWRQSDGMTH